MASLRRRAVMEMSPAGAAWCASLRAVLPDELAGDLCVSVHYVVTKPG
jgi:hypothetical protein